MYLFSTLILFCICTVVPGEQVSAAAMITASNDSMQNQNMSGTMTPSSATLSSNKPTPSPLAASPIEDVPKNDGKSLEGRVSDLEKKFAWVKARLDSEVPIEDVPKHDDKSLEGRVSDLEKKLVWVNAKLDSEVSAHEVDSEVSAHEDSSTGFQWVLALFLGFTTAIILKVFREEWVEHSRPSWKSAFMVAYGLATFLIFTSYSSMAHLWTYLGLPVGALYVLCEHWIYWQKTTKPITAWVDRFRCDWDSRDSTRDHSFLPRAVAMDVYWNHMKNVPNIQIPSEIARAISFRKAASESNSLDAAKMSRKEAVKWMVKFAKNNWKIISKMSARGPDHQHVV